MPERPTGKRRPVGGGPAEPVDAAPADDEAELAEEAELQEAEEAELQEAEEAELQGADEAEPAPPAGRRERWRRRSATGAILTGFALGLQEVFEPEKKEPAIVMETSGDPPRDLPVEAELELAARRSVVRIRPWLLDDEEHAAGEGAAEEHQPGKGS